MTVQDIRQEWLEQYSVADEIRIEALDDDTRTAVERYARAFASLSSDADDDDDDDLAGIEDVDVYSIANDVCSDLENDIASAIRSAIGRAKRKRSGGR